MRPNLKILLCFCVPLLALSAEQGPKSIPRPEADELERTVGERIEAAVKVRSWTAPEPKNTKPAIYAVAAPQLDEILMRRVAQTFGVTGELKRISGDTLGQLGFEIREAANTNSGKYRTVYFWLSTGRFGYDTGDDGYRYDRITKQHDVRGVPDKEEAKGKALDILPILSLSTNDLEHYPNGRLKWSSSGSTISYTDRVDNQRKIVVIARHVSFYQRVPYGGVTAGVGDGGRLRFSFVSEGKLASIELFFRKLVKVDEAKPKSSKEIIRDLRSQNAWSWYRTIASAMTITSCDLAYPQANSWFQQEYVRPFYMLNGTDSDGRTATLFVPAEW